MTATPQLEPLLTLLRGRRVVVLAGAGMSTASGIPDYRGPGTRMRARNPVKYRAFVDDADARRRYWARSVVGWPRFRGARPNPGHEALARLEASGLSPGVITQNVDGLHQAAGSERVVELHGALQRVRCLSCGTFEHRDAFQRRLIGLNPGWEGRRAELAPDGDAELPSALVEGFIVATCTRCQGVLKPHVVFFGESVPPETTRAAWDLFDEGEALLVAGSSLAVFSGYRFVRKARKRGWPVGIVNLGPTRGDADADVTVDGDVVDVLPRLVEGLGSVGPAPRPTAG